MPRKSSPWSSWPATPTHCWSSRGHASASLPPPRSRRHLATLLEGSSPGGGCFSSRRGSSSPLDCSSWGPASRSWACARQGVLFYPARRRPGADARGQGGDNCEEIGGLRRMVYAGTHPLRDRRLQPCVRVHGLQASRICHMGRDPEGHGFEVQGGRDSERLLPSLHT